MHLLRHQCFSLLILTVSLTIAAPCWGATVEERVARLEEQVKQMKETANFNNKRLAEALASFEAIREEINTLVGQIGTIRHEVGQGGQQNSQQLQEMSHRLARMEEQLGDQIAMIRDLSSGQPAGTETQTKGKQAAAELLYKKAFSDMTQRNYKKSAELFAAFIKKYPKSPLADNAQYWRGESLYAMGDYEAAILEFQTVIKKYPKGDKVPGAILKQGFAFFELKSYADAKAFLEKVIIEYPKSEEALKAREKITQVDAMIRESTAQMTE